MAFMVEENECVANNRKILVQIIRGETNVNVNININFKK